MFTRTLYVARLDYPTGETKAFYGNHDQALAYYKDFIQDCIDCDRKGSACILQEATSTIDEYGITSLLSNTYTISVWRYDVFRHIQNSKDKQSNEVHSNA